jgi:hypothetical protein
VLALLTIVFLRHVITPPGVDQALNGADFPGMFYPLHEHIRQLVLAGELPFWNPRQFIGHPNIGNPHSALFYPATWFMWLVGLPRGMNLVLVFHTWLAAWGMAQLARNFGASYVGSLLAGVIYAMSGWSAAHYYAGHYNLLVVYAWIPWAMTAYRNALSRGTWRSTLPGIAILGIALLGGHPPMMVYMVICLITLWVYHTMNGKDVIQAGWYAGRLLVILGIGGLILGAAMALPAAELTTVSARSSSSDLAFANAFALPPAQFASAFALPGFFGNPKVGPYYYWGMDFIEEFVVYAGLLPLLAVPLAIRWRWRERWYFIGLLALGVVLSVGADGALMPILVRWVPGFGSFRAPGRALFLAMVALAGLTAQLVTVLQTSSPAQRRKMLRPAVRRWIPIAAVIAFSGAIFFAGWYGSASHVEPMPLRAFIVSGSLASAGIILLGVWLVLWLWSESSQTHVPTVENELDQTSASRPNSAPLLAGEGPGVRADLPRRWVLLLTVVLIILDAWHASFPLITVGAIREHPLWAGARINVPAGPDARVIAAGPFENLASVTGHLNVQGYDPLPVEAYRRLRELTEPNDPTTRINTLLGVKYYMAEKPYDNPNFELIGIAPGGIYYRRKDPFPRAWIAKTVTVVPNDDIVRQHIASGTENLRENVYIDRPFPCQSDGIGSAEIIEYRPNDIAIKTSGSGGLLTLSDQFYPGWLASIDGVPTEIVRADTVFRAVCVPPGDHTVRFEYRPMSLYIGLALTVLGWLVMAVLAFVARRPRAST